MAAGAVGLDEERLAGFGLGRRLVRLGRREEHRPAHQIEEVLDAELGVGHAVVVGGADARGDGGLRVRAAADERVPARARLLGDLGRHRKGGGELRRERVGGDAQVVEERPADEALDGDGLRLAAEAAHEAALVVGPTADAVAVGVVRIGVLQDHLVRQLGDQADAEEGNRVSGREVVGALGRGEAAAVDGVLREHAVDAEVDAGAVREGLADEQEVAVVGTGATEDRLLVVTGGAEGDVEGRAETIGRLEAPGGHLLAAGEGLELLGGRARHRLAHRGVDVLGGLRVAGAPGERQGEPEDQGPTHHRPALSRTRFPHSSPKKKQSSRQRRSGDGWGRRRPHGTFRRCPATLPRRSAFRNR